MNPYKLLGLELEATKPEIMKAFRKKAREVHPDKNKSPQAAKEFQKLLKARDILLEGTAANAVKLRGKGVKQSPEKAPQKSAAEIKKEQNLDQQATKKKGLFQKEPREVTLHRQKLKTAKQRLSGKY